MLSISEMRIVDFVGEEYMIKLERVNKRKNMKII